MAWTVAGSIQGPEGPQGPQGDPGPAGISGVNWEGPYNGATAYTQNDVVSYQGSAYITSGSVTGTVPTNDDGATTNSPWSLFVAEGAQGPQGVAGSAGSAGATGSTGPQGPRGSLIYTGNGAPGTISGSLPGDHYVDLESGEWYTLS